MSTLSKNSKSKITGIGFEFIPEGHSYYLDGNKMTGCTTVLQIISKPQLIPWASKMACEYASARINADTKYTEDELTTIFTEAKNAHRTKKEEAGAKGTDVHAEIETIIKVVLSGGVLLKNHDNEQVQHFIDWAVQNKVEFVASEEKVYSRDLFVAGTMDFVCKIDGEYWLGDVKTSSAIYPEYFFQTAGYQKLNEDMVKNKDGGMPVDFKGHIILNCRKDNTFEEKRSISNEDNVSAFLSALNLYRITKKLEGNIL